jgi:RNA polymerase primary sigma factor
MAARKTLLVVPTRSARLTKADGTRPAPRQPALDETARAQVYRQWRRGVSVDLLAQQYGRSRASIQHAVNEGRAHRILEQKLEYVDHSSFADPAAEAEILAPMPVLAGKASAARIKPPAGLPPYLASLYGDGPLLSREQEAHLFRKMNYLKYRAARLRERLVPERARTADLDAIERFQEEALAVKNQIIRANLRLVVSISKKRVGTTNNFFELVSDGNMSLIRAVEKFDYARGFKFSTYASWAIMKNFARSIPEEKSRRDRFVTGHEEMFEAAADHRTGEREYESDHRRNQEAVAGMLGRLNDRERQILVSRYGLGGASEMTLEQLGKEMGITKERVRQIESKAQEKLRKFALEQRMEPPAA